MKVTNVKHASKKVAGKALGTRPFPSIVSMFVMLKKKVSKIRRLVRIDLKSIQPKSPRAKALNTRLNRHKELAMKMVHKFATLGGKSERARFARAGLITAALAATLLLAACGGGGTSTPPVVTPPTGNLIGTVGGTIAKDASSGTAAVVWSVINPVKPLVVVGGATLSTAPSGNQSVTLGHGPTTVSLSDGTNSLSSLSISMDCVTGTSWDGNACKSVAPAVYKYARLNLVIFADQHATIGVISGEIVTPLANASEFTGNAGFPLVLCALWDKLLTDGRPLASCVTPLAGNTRRNFPINPFTSELMKEYTGAVPAGAVLRDVSDSSLVGPPDHVAANTPFYGMYIDVPSVGTYFFTGTDSVNLRLTKDGFATNKIIHVGDHKFLATYSNP